MAAEGSTAGAVSAADMAVEAATVKAAVRSKTLSHFQRKGRTMNIRPTLLPCIAAGLCAAPLLGPARLVAAQPVPAAASSKVAAKTGALTPTDDVGARIKRLHDHLRITPEQESLWVTVAAVMADNAKSLTAAMQVRQDKMPTMNAVDDIQSYGAVAEAHAAGLKSLAAAFAPLYAAMPPAQQQNANAVFANKALASRKG